MVIGDYGAAAAAAKDEDDGLIGADEVAEPLLSADPLVEPAEAKPAEVEGVLGDPPGMDPLLEPTLEPIPEDEGRSLEEIIAAAERQEAENKGQGGSEDEPVAAAPLVDEAALAEPVDEDGLLKETFPVTLLPEPHDD